jgi:hypothetical protein
LTLSLLLLLLLRPHARLHLRALRMARLTRWLARRLMALRLRETASLLCSPFLWGLWQLLALMRRSLMRLAVAQALQLAPRCRRMQRASASRPWSGATAPAMKARRQPRCRLPLMALRRWRLPAAQRARLALSTWRLSAEARAARAAPSSRDLHRSLRTPAAVLRHAARWRRRRRTPKRRCLCLQAVLRLPCRPPAALRALALPLATRCRTAQRKAAMP